MNPPVGNAFMTPGPAVDPRQIEEDVGVDVGSEPGSGLGYPMDGDIRIISREIYQGKTFDDWDDMEANVRRLARKAGFKVVKDSKGEKRADGRQKRIVWKCDCAGIKTPRKSQKDLSPPASRERPSKRQGCPFQINATWPEKCLQPGVTRCTLEHNHRLSGPLRAGRQDPVLPEELLAEHVSALKEWARIPVAVRTQMQILRHEFFEGRQLSLEAQRCVHTLSGQEAPRRRAAAAAAAVAAAAAAAPAAVVASLPASRVNDPIFRESMTTICNALRQALESGADAPGLKRRCDGFAEGLRKTTVAASDTGVKRGRDGQLIMGGLHPPPVAAPAPTAPAMAVPAPAPGVTLAGLSVAVPAPASVPPAPPSVTEGFVSAP